MTMLFARCDFCCNVLDGIDNGEVFECANEVFQGTGFQHLCKDCINNFEDLCIDEEDNHNYITYIVLNN